MPSSPPSRPFPVLKAKSVRLFIGSSGFGGKSEARESFAANFIIAAAEGRNLENADDVFNISAAGGRGGSLLRHPLYSGLIQFAATLHLCLPFISSSYHQWLVILDACILGLFIFHSLLLVAVCGPGIFVDKKWLLGFTCLTVAQLFLFCSEIFHPTASSLAIRLGQSLRPYVLISQLPIQRRVLANVVRTIWHMRDALLTASILLCFFAVLCVSVFNSEQVPSGYSPENDNFDAFAPALLSLFVLVTTENYPFVADPAYQARPWLGYPIFSLFILIFLLVILPLLLSSALDGYVEQHGAGYQRFRSKARKALIAAYYIMDDEGRKGISCEQFVRLLTLVSKRHGGRPQGKVCSEAQLRTVWQELCATNEAQMGNPIAMPHNKDRGDLKVAGFLNLVDYMDISSAHRFWKVGALPRELAKDPGACVGRYELSEFQLKVERTVRSPFATHVWQVNAVLLAIASCMWSPAIVLQHTKCVEASEAFSPRDGCRPLSFLWIFESILLMVYLLELGLKAIGAGGVWRFIRCLDSPRFHWWRFFDIMVLLFSLSAFVFLLLAPMSWLTYLDERQYLGDWLDLPRALRVLRLLVAFEATRNIGLHLSDALPAVVRIMFLYCAISYSFAAVGMALFGDTTTIELEPRYNFSTYPNAVLCMFFLTVTNNWNDLMYPLINEHGRWTALFFVSYMLLCSTIMLDILVGVIIEGFRVLRNLQNEVPALAAGSMSSSPVARFNSAGLSTEGSDKEAYGSFEGRGLKWRQSSQSSSFTPDALFDADRDDGITPSEMLELEVSVNRLEKKLYSRLDPNGISSVDEGPDEDEVCQSEDDVGEEKEQVALLSAKGLTALKQVSGNFRTL